jgi:hypothetical protein
MDEGGVEDEGGIKAMTRWREATDATSPIGVNWSCQMTIQ